MKSKIKNISLSLGTVAAIAVPIVTVVACVPEATWGDEGKMTPKLLGDEQTRINSVVDSVNEVIAPIFNELNDVEIDSNWIATNGANYGLSSLTLDEASFTYIINTTKSNTGGTIVVSVSSKEDNTIISSIQPSTETVTFITTPADTEQERVNTITSLTGATTNQTLVIADDFRNITLSDKVALGLDVLTFDESKYTYQIKVTPYTLADTTTTIKIRVIEQNIPTRFESNDITVNLTPKYQLVQVYNGLGDSWYSTVDAASASMKATYVPATTGYPKVVDSGNTNASGNHLYDIVLVPNKDEAIRAMKAIPQGSIVDTTDPGWQVWWTTAGIMKVSGAGSVNSDLSTLNDFALNVNMGQVTVPASMKWFGTTGNQITVDPGSDADAYISSHIAEVPSKQAFIEVGATSGTSGYSSLPSECPTI